MLQALPALRPRERVVARKFGAGAGELWRRATLFPMFASGVGCYI